ncbi:MAG: hypothetical protein ACI8WT_000327 [Clostridium sp.]|jgi:hypothetical protein
MRIFLSIFPLKNKNRLTECVFKGFTKEEWVLLKKNRMKMNTDDGYYILSHDKCAIANGIYNQYPLEYWSSCLLSSDGISILDKYYPRNELMDLMRTKGVKSLIEELRSYECEDEAMAIADRIVIMKDGKVQQIGTPSEVYEYPKNKFVADFMGACNFF